MTNTSGVAVDSGWLDITVIKQTWQSGVISMLTAAAEHREAPGPVPLLKAGGCGLS